MAVNKMLHINETVGKNPNTHLKNAIDYISNPKKTDGGKNIFSINCDKENAFEDMVDLKSSYGKEKRGDTHYRQGYHFIISFSPEDNVSTDLCQEITKEFCMEYFKNRYQILVATHDDQPHKHSHIIFNSVAIDNGLKYYYKKGDWKRDIIPILNSLCEKHGLSTIELGGLEEEDLSFFNKYETSKSKMTMEKTIKNEIDNMITKAYSFEHLLNLLRENNYKVKVRGEKSISITPPGFTRPRRLSSIPGCSREELEARIKNNKNVKPPVFEKRKRVISFQKNTIIGIKKTWAKKIIKTVRIGNMEYKVAYKYEDAFKLVERQMKEFHLLREKQLASKNEVSTYINRLKEEKKQACSELKKINKKYENYKSEKKQFSRLKKLEPCVKAYNAGNNFFEDEFKEFNAIKKELRVKNVDSVNPDQLFLQYSGLKKKVKKISSDKNTAERILQEMDSERDIENISSGIKKEKNNDKEVKK